jgi:hypothetical protein
MLLFDARKFDIQTYVLDPSEKKLKGLLATIFPG